MAKIPESCASERQYLLGLAGLAVGIVASRVAELPAQQAAIIVAVGALLPMWVLERRQRHGLAPSQSTAISPIHRVCLRTVGLSLALIGLMVSMAALEPLQPGLAAMPYGLLVDGWIFLAVLAAGYSVKGFKPSSPLLDDLERLGGLALYRRTPKSAIGDAKTLLLGWMIKWFFAPLMWSGLVFWVDMASAPAAPMPWLGWFVTCFSLMYVADNAFALIGYLTASRTLNTEIRSCQPRLIGWIVTLACYAPFFGLLTTHIGDYRDGYSWYDWLPANSVIAWIWGLAILSATAIYVWATVAFGLRFSNLTYRGIITHGPYRYTKHPSYLAKNIAFWLIAIPIVSPAGLKEALYGTAALIMVNLIYVARAKTEEMHLSEYPEYREYKDWIAANGIFARLARTAFRK